MKKTAAQPRPRFRVKERIAIGWREWIGLPGLGLRAVKAKVDTGARTSSLHAIDIEPFVRNGKDMVRFEVHPFQRETRTTVVVEARVLSRRSIRSSSGHEQTRYIIRTTAKLGEIEWPIELSLTSRSEMGFRMLLGRQALHSLFIVDSARSYVYGRRSRRGKPLLKTKGSIS